MDVWSIASGSSGNAYLVRTGDTAVLLECGIPLRRITSFLAKVGVSPFDLAGVLLTHDHSDHTRAARQFSESFEVPLYGTAGTLGCKALRETPGARAHACEKAPCSRVEPGSGIPGSARSLQSPPSGRSLAPGLACDGRPPSARRSPVAAEARCFDPPAQR